MISALLLLSGIVFGDGSQLSDFVGCMRSHGFPVEHLYSGRFVGWLSSAPAVELCQFLYSHFVGVAAAVVALWVGVLLSNAKHVESRERPHVYD
jgi:hypothetical protein